MRYIVQRDACNAFVAATLTDVKVEECTIIATSLNGRLLDLMIIADKENNKAKPDESFLDKLAVEMTILKRMLHVLENEQCEVRGTTI